MGKRFCGSPATGVYNDVIIYDTHCRRKVYSGKMYPPEAHHTRHWHGAFYVVFAVANEGPPECFADPFSFAIPLPVVSFICFRDHLPRSDMYIRIAHLTKGPHIPRTQSSFRRYRSYRRNVCGRDELKRELKHELVLAEYVVWQGN